jgi:hypothetical protein
MVILFCKDYDCIDKLDMSLLEKRFIRTPAYQYWCRLVTVANTNNGWLTSRYQ